MSIPLYASPLSFDRENGSEVFLPPDLHRGLNANYKDILEETKFQQNNKGVSRNRIAIGNKIFEKISLAKQRETADGDYDFFENGYYYIDSSGKIKNYCLLELYTTFHNPDIATLIPELPEVSNSYPVLKEIKQNLPFLRLYRNSLENGYNEYFLMSNIEGDQVLIMDALLNEADFQEMLKNTDVRQTIENLAQLQMSIQNFTL